MKLVMVEWTDSCGCSSSWREKDELNRASPVQCVSVGLLLVENDEYIVVVPHYADHTPNSEWQGCGDMTIPRVLIKQMRDLVVSPQ